DGIRDYKVTGVQTCALPISQVITEERAGQQMFTAKNPPYGALLSYYLREAVPPEAPARNSGDRTDAAEQRPRREARVEAAEKKEIGRASCRERVQIKKGVV